MKNVSTNSVVVAVIANLAIAILFLSYLMGLPCNAETSMCEVQTIIYDFSINAEIISTLVAYFFVSIALSIVSFLILMLD